MHWANPAGRTSLTEISVCEGTVLWQGVSVQGQCLGWGQWGKRAEAEGCREAEQERGWGKIGKGLLCEVKELGLLS